MAMMTAFNDNVSLCSACTVHVNGRATPSCVTSVSPVSGKEIITIQRLSPDVSHPVQQAWIAENVLQCGYCQSGQIMAAAAFLAGNRSPSDAEIDKAMARNICRCGTYQCIRRAVHSAAQIIARSEKK
jgi:isoquinoline 1-oxidoreductase alpha subunit